MRRFAFIALAISTLFACGSPPPVEAKPAVADAPSASAAAVASAPPPAPPLPPEPAGLKTIAPPRAVCEVGGDISDGVELAAHAESPALFRLSATSAKMTVGPDGVAYVDAIKPSLRVHGLLARKPALVHPAKWIAFGGVYFPGAGDRVGITGAHDGKVVVTAPAIPSFTFLGDAATAEAPCGDVSLSVHANGNLQHEAPASFQAHGATRTMLLKPATLIPIAPDADAPATASFDASKDPRSVVVIEQHGAKSHIRIGHVSGWVATSMLVAAPKRTRAQELSEQLATMNMAMLGAFSGTAAPPPSSFTAVTCPDSVRVIAETAAVRAVIGSIPANITVRITEKGADVSYILLDENVAPSGARFAVPNRDLASCTAAAPPPPPATTRGLTQSPVAPPDAIDALDIVALVPPSGIKDAPPAPSLAIRSGPPTALMRIGAVQVNGKMAPEIVQRNVDGDRDRLRACYESTLRTNPALSGRISTRFVIDETGKVTSAESNADLPVPVVTCVRQVFKSLRFPAPASGTVTVVYPLTFAPADDPTPPNKK